MPPIAGADHAGHVDCKLDMCRTKGYHLGECHCKVAKWVLATSDITNSWTMLNAEVDRARVARVHVPRVITGMRSNFATQDRTEVILGWLDTMGSWGSDSVFQTEPKLNQSSGSVQQ